MSGWAQRACVRRTRDQRQNRNPMTTDGVVPWYYSIHVFALRTGCDAAYPTTNTARRDPPLLCWVGR